METERMKLLLINELLLMKPVLNETSINKLEKI